MVLVVAVNSRIERPCVNDRDAWRQPSSFPRAHGSGSFPLCELCLAYRFARGRRTVGVWLTISHRPGTRSALPERSPRSSCCGGAVRSRVDRPGHLGEEPWSGAYVHISIRVWKTTGTLPADGRDRCGATRGGRIFSMEKDEIPAEQNKHREVRRRDRFGLELHRTPCLDDAVASFEQDQRFVVVLPHPFGLPEICRRQADGAAVGKLQRPATDPAWLKDRRVGFGARGAHCYARVPEALALEGPVTAGRLRIGQRPALEPQRGDDIV